MTNDEWRMTTSFFSYFFSQAVLNISSHIKWNETRNWWKIGLYFPLALIVSVTSIVVPHSWAQGTAISDVQSQLGNSNASSSTDIVSLVENVTVTKFDILSPRQLGVELRYAGTGNSPVVKVDISAINIDSKLADDITNEINNLNASTGDSNSNQSLATDPTNGTSLMLDICRAPALQDQMLPAR